MTQQELTVGHVERWLDKLDLIKGKVTKVVHVKHLLQLHSQDLKRKIEEMRQQRTEKRYMDDAYDSALDDVLALLEGE